MIVLTSDVHMKSFSKIVNHSTWHIEWNSGDFLMDSLLYSFNGSRSMYQKTPLQSQSHIVVCFILSTHFGTLFYFYFFVERD
jgi:hypothetical protein